MSNVAAVITGVGRALAQGRVEQARTMLQRALQSDGGQPDLNNAMAVVLVQAGQQERALYFAQRASAARPGDAELLATLGSVQSGLGRHEEAAGTLRRALEINPRAANASLALANSLSRLRRYSESETRCAQALAASPADTELSIARARALVNLGRAPEAVGEIRRLLALRPDDQGALAWLPYGVNYLPQEDPESALEIHRRAGEVIQQRIRPLPPPTGARDPDRRLRVGLVSPDLRTHSVAYFIEPLLAHLDRAQAGAVCYSTGSREDATSARLRGLCDQWRSVGGEGVAEIGAQVRADGIDILIDLAGHTDRLRLEVFAMRPAPVQATYLGYPNTTGLSTIDYRIVDALTDPPGHERYSVERLVRLDECFLCYRPAPEAPEVVPPPSAAGAPVTFGSFNTLSKLNDRVVSCWSRVLRAVPGSRLVLKAVQLVEEETRRATLARFESAGIEPGRVEVLPPAGATAEHLGLYARVDIALDPFPYAGTTTTCEALWMGVPVVTLCGRSHAGRVGASLLRAVGLGALVAGDEEQYVRLAAALASQGGRLADERASLRARVSASPLCDGQGFGQRFGAALREMWRGYCTSE